MKGTVLVKPNEIQVLELETPEPKAGELRIKLTKVGICGSDVHLFLGHRLLDKALTIGHEGLGYIDKIGEGVQGRTVGERVIIEPNIPCGHCKHCLSGNGNICVNKRVIGVNEAGCFAEYIVVPANFAWKIPDEISDENAVTIEPMAVAVHALFEAKVKPGDTIAVVGLGAIGLLITHLALALGYKVLVTEINSHKVEMATALGAISAIATGDLAQQTEELSAIWEAHDVEAVFECAGVSHTASLATAATPRGAEIILVGLANQLATFRPLKIAREGIHIVPSIIYKHPFDFKRTIQLIASKVINPSFIISSHYPLQDLQTALSEAAKGHESKVIVNIA